MPKKLMKIPLYTTLAYLLVGSLWILFTDRILNFFVSDKETLSLLQTFKGWFYVILTAALLYSLLKFFIRKENLFRQQIINSLEHKQTLIYEIQHRVRNNLQILSAFIELEKQLYPEENNPVFSGILSRIKILGFVHARILENPDASPIRLFELTQSIFFKTFESPSSQISSLRVQGKSLALKKTHQAVPIGLLIREALFYLSGGISPFCTGETLTLTVHSENQNVFVSLKIQKNPPWDSPTQTASFKLSEEIMRALAQQLGGSFTLEPDQIDFTLPETLFKSDDIPLESSESLNG